MTLGIMSSLMPPKTGIRPGGHRPFGHVRHVQDEYRRVELIRKINASSPVLHHLLQLIFAIILRSGKLGRRISTAFPRVDFQYSWIAHRGYFKLKKTKQTWTTCESRVVVGLSRVNFVSNTL